MGGHDDLLSLGHDAEPLLFGLEHHSPFDSTYCTVPGHSIDDDDDGDVDDDDDDDEEGGAQNGFVPDNQIPPLLSARDGLFVPLEDTTSASCSSLDSPTGSSEDKRRRSAGQAPPAKGKAGKWKAEVPVLAAGTERDSHNAMERMRRVNIRSCFQSLQNSIPELRAKKSHSLNILQEGARYIHFLRAQARPAFCMHSGDPRAGRGAPGVEGCVAEAEPGAPPAAEPAAERRVTCP